MLTELEVKLGPYFLALMFAVLRVARVADAFPELMSHIHPTSGTARSVDCARAFTGCRCRLQAVPVGGTERGVCLT